MLHGTASSRGERGSVQGKRFHHCSMQLDGSCSAPDRTAQLGILGYRYSRCVRTICWMYNDPARTVQHSILVVLNAPRSSPEGAPEASKPKDRPCRPPDFHTRPHRGASRNGDDATQPEGERTNWNPYHRRGSTNICLPQASQISMPDVARRTLIVDHTMPNTGAGGHQSGLLRS